MNRFKISLTKHKSSFQLFVLSMLMLLSNAANAAGLDLNDTFFRSGKYFVVAGVLTIMFVIIFIYLIRLEMKVTKIEKSIKNED